VAVDGTAELGADQLSVMLLAVGLLALRPVT
jgi:hypothetical protein